jgi:hypothetical protein
MRRNAPTEVAFRLCAMNPTTVTTSIRVTDPVPAVQQRVSTVDTSLVTLPATRVPVDARGLALGVLAALASVFALSWAQSFLEPLLLGIIVAYTLNPLSHGLKRSGSRVLSAPSS